MNLAWSGHNFRDMVYNLPTPVLILVAAVLAIVAYGVFSHMKNIARGKASVMDYLILLAMLVLVALTAVLVLKIH